jgi:hypothetical protein
MNWISVKDELPGSGEIVLAYGIGKRPSMTKFEGNVFKRYVDTIKGDRVQSIYYDKITHWMPLPEKPDN